MKRYPTRKEGKGRGSGIRMDGAKREAHKAVRELRMFFLIIMDKDDVLETRGAGYMHMIVE